MIEEVQPDSKRWHAAISLITATFLVMAGQSRVASAAPSTPTTPAIPATPPPPAPPFTECPAVGADTSCGILIYITDGGITVFDDPSQGPYDSVEDTLVGVLNASSGSVQTLALHGQTVLFGFDGDGPCSYNPSYCSGPTGYEGPGTSFSDIGPDQTSGLVGFSNALNPGATAWFGLEEALTSSDVEGGTGQSQVTAYEQGMAINQFENTTTCSTGPPVNCATGEFWHTFADIGVPGVGLHLTLSRTYNSMAASQRGRFGYGWSDSYGMSLSIASSGTVMVNEGDGAAALFTPAGGGTFVAPSRVFATLTQGATGVYALTDTRKNAVYTFSPAGALLSESDLNGYVTTLSYVGTQLTTVTDPSDRSVTFSYNAAGLVASASDPMGRTTAYSYDSAGDLVSVADPMGRRTQFAYDSAHRMLSMTDPRGGITTNAYDSQGRVVSQTVPPGRTTTFAYSGDPSTNTGSTTTITDPLGVATTHTYKSFQLVAVTQGSGGMPSATWSYAYDPFTLGLAAITGPGGSVSRFTYDRSGNTLTATDPLGRTKTTTYNRFGEPTQVVLPSGEQTTSTYNSAGNLLSTTSSGASEQTSASYTYGAPSLPGEMSSLTDANGNVWHFGYDGHGDLTSLVDPLGDTRTSDFDLDGETMRTVMPLGNHKGVDAKTFTTTSTYDADGELFRTTGPAGTTSHTYDADGNVTSTVAPSGATTTYSWDAANEQIGTTGPDGATSSAKYDADGNQISSANADGQTTTRIYDQLNRIRSVTGPLGTTTYTYDATGNQNGVSGPDGVTKMTTFDAAGEPLSVAYSDATPTVTYRYDQAGRKVSMTDGSGTSTFTYDGLGRLSTTTDGSGATTAYSYDPAGDVTAIKYPDDHAVTYTYDATGNMASVSDWAGRTTTFGFDADSELTTQAYPNGVVTTRQYDPAGRVMSLTDAIGTNALASFTYTRDGNGLLTSATTAGTAQMAGERTFSYTAAGELSAVDGQSYDTSPTGNLLSSPAGPLSYNTADQLVRATLNASTTSTYGYNAAGDRTTTVVAQAAACDLCVLGGGPGALSAVGAPTIVSGGPGAVDSSDPAAVLAEGNATVTANPLRVAGGVQVTGPARVTGRSSGPVPGDPLAGLTPPSVSGRPVALRVGNGQNVTALPGVYASITVSGSASLTLAAGTYVLEGPLTVSGASKVRAAGVTLYLACTTWPSPCPANANGGALDVTGKDEVTIRGATLGGTPDVAIASDSLDVASSQVTGSSTVDITGSVHLPSSTLEVSGSAAFHLVQGVLAVGSLSAVGKATVSVDQQPGQGPMGTTTSTSYTWNGAGELTALNSPGLSAASTYNGDGLRTDTVTNGVAQHFVYRESGAAAPLVLTDGRYDYVYGPDGLPIEEVATDQSVTYLHQDQLGSTVLATGSTGMVTGTWSYNPYGTQAGHQGTATSPLGFAGAYTDQTGLLYLIDRYYDPASGQFLSVDPASGASGDSYSYAAGDPVNEVDPLGTQAFPAYCTIALVTCLATDMTFPTPSEAEAYVDDIQGGTGHMYFQTPCGGRFVDVYNGSIIEVKTGGQSATGFVLNQVAKDQALVTAGGGISTGGQWYPVEGAEWDFFPNGAGVTAPSVPLLTALSQAGIPSFVYLYQSPPEEPVPVPVPVPEPAPSPSVPWWILIGGGALAGACILLTDGLCALAPVVAPAF